jgi:hypothetical protein
METELNLVLDDLNYDENIFNDKYFLWGMRIPKPFIDDIKKAFNMDELKKYRIARKKVKVSMFMSCANVIGLPPDKDCNIDALSNDIDSKEIVIRHGESKSYIKHGLGLYGKRYNIGLFSHQTFQIGYSHPEPKDLKNDAGDILNIFTPIRNYLNLNEFNWFYSKNTHDKWCILHPEIYRNLAYILIHYYSKIHEISFEEMQEKKNILNENVVKTYAYGTTPYPTAGLFQIFIGIYLSKNVYIYGANLQEKDFTKKNFKIGDPHCIKTEKAFLRDLVNKNMEHIPKKYFPFDLKDTNNKLYRSINVVF